MKIFIKILAIISLSLQLKAQETFILRHFTIKDGLSQSTINCIFQSSDGILWFGTIDGLNIFDGKKFYSFHYNPTDSNSIPSNYINDITEDSLGNIIIATRKGFAIWNRKNNKIKRIKIPKQNNNSFAQYDILKIIATKNTIWALTPKNLLKYSNKKIIKYKIIKSDTKKIYNSLNTVQHLDLKSEPNGNIWIATINGLFVFYPKSENFYRIYDNNSGNSISNNAINCILNTKNYIWIGTNSGLNRFEKNTGKIKSFFFINPKKYPKQNKINYIFLNEKNQLLLATDKGLKIFKNNKITNINLNNPLSKLNSKIIQIKKDKSNNIWIATFSDGIYQLKKINSCFKKLPQPLYDSINNVYSICETNDKLWIGGKKLFVLNKKNNKILLNISNKKYKKFQKNFYISFLNDNKNLWAGTSKGIIIINKNTLKITNFNTFFKLKKYNIIQQSSIFSIIKDKNNNYWLGTNNGLIKFDGKTTELFSNKINKPINSSIITKILLDSDNLWLASYNGLYKLSLKNNKAKHWTTKNGLINNSISDIYKQNDSIIWIATDGGLSKFNTKNQHFKNFNSQNYGFINDMFYQIQADSLQNLYISSNYGIVKFNTKNLSYYTFDQKDGLPFYEFNGGASFKNSKGTIYFGGLKGLIWFSGIPQKTKITPPKLKILKIDKIIQLEKKQTIFFPDTNKTYTFKEKEIINIKFFTPDYSFPQKNKYKFKIPQINKKWINIQNQITLAALKHGKYTILLKGSNGYGNWNNSPTRLKIIIKPPFSKSTLAKFIYILIIFILLVSIFIFFYFNIKKDNRILQEKNLALKQVDYQKKLLEQKNKDITDSINYAKRIIDAILPPIENFKHFIPESFIYFLPKDIVSGDFYWFGEKNDYFFIAAVDCTGHGIPGAFMSIIGINLLNKFINEGIDDPGVILNMMNKEVILTLKKQVDTTHLKDGMDMSLCVIDKRRQLLKFSGAYNPAYVIRDNNIIQLKGARISVGNDFDFDSFTTFSMKIRPDDFVYLFSDGYTDQFGGPELKKFKFRRFRFILLSIYELDPEQQKEKLDETLMKWKGNNEQVDDVLVIGFKPFSVMNK